ncbi:hypothetical protein SAMN05444397_1069 [Flavobacterium aquidurense]|uniref:DUF4430 domain-containing protein n=1 Tax=Flavobacterium frigidimaris TaxID=262320 RepID=A0ABX4BJL1_FLAFR|nr:hypothetical protein [Flavobacterium frigidimaris]OXA74904.1 hypothetical protein B0A65_22885 [Flavobacterium frigidimaris]SDZ38057.1 hypothetical protein SAMN05444397_1069 [Flavobacterium aquidurense]
MKLSKEKKIELFIILLACTIIVAIFINFKNLHIKFYNKTGENINSLVVAGTLIGHMKNGSSTEFIDYKEFLFDSGIPYEQISGLINNKKIEQFNWSDCGTERNTESEGSYIFDIKKATDEKGNTCLYLIAHNKKIFWE